MLRAAAAVRTFNTLPCETGVVAERSKSSSPVPAFITAPVKPMSLGSVASAAMEQVRRRLAAGMAAGTGRPASALDDELGAASTLLPTAAPAKTAPVPSRRKTTPSVAASQPVGLRAMRPPMPPLGTVAPSARGARVVGFDCAASRAARLDPGTGGWVTRQY